MWASLPTFCWRCRPRCTGIYTIIFQTLLPLLHCRCCCIGVVSLVIPTLPPPSRMPRHHRCAGVFLVALALPPALRWRLCWCSTGVNTLVVLASTPLFCGSCCRCCRCCTGVVALVAPACQPALRGCLCRRSAGVIALIAPVLLPSSHERLHRRSAGVNTHITLAYKPSFC